MRSLDKSEATGRRWAREGRIVLVRLGREPLVDVKLTTELVRKRGRSGCRCGPSSDPEL
jgi:hypothetical protein